MKLASNHPVLTIIAVCLTGFVGLVLFEYLFIKFSGTSVAVPQIPRGVEQFGTTGAPLRYAVIGDSTSIGQGADYAAGIARGTANHLAISRRIELQNFGVSGARCQDVVHDQLTAVLAFKPDLIVVAVGANDVTHLTSPSAIADCMNKLLTDLQSLVPQPKIVITGSPQMGSVPRFAQPLRWIARIRTEQVNNMLIRIAAEHGITFAYLAQQTGQRFSHDHSLFAQDNFHPNAQGYAVWIPVLNTAIDRALQ